MKANTKLLRLFQTRAEKRPGDKPLVSINDFGVEVNTYKYLKDIIGVSYDKRTKAINEFIKRKGSLSLSYLDNYIDADTHYDKGYDSVMDMPIQVLSFASGGDTYSIIRVNKGVPHAFKVNSLIILSPEITTTLNKRQVFKPLNKDTLLYVDTSTIVPNNPSFNLSKPIIAKTSLNEVGY